LKYKDRIWVAKNHSPLISVSSRVTVRNDHGDGMPECTPAVVWIFGWSRSQYFKLEPEKEPE